MQGLEDVLLFLRDMEEDVSTFENTILQIVEESCRFDNSQKLRMSALQLLANKASGSPEERFMLILSEKCRDKSKTSSSQNAGLLAHV